MDSQHRLTQEMMIPRTLSRDSGIVPGQPGHDGGLNPNANTFHRREDGRGIGLYYLVSR